ncbi:MAG: response regulator [Nitriliruptorales bacterium]|nr:response regulator [Nitriliruptorales bacterium]
MSTAVDSGVVRVLVVDDEPDVRFMLRHLLSNADGFEMVGEAADGAKAVELAQRLQPDVIVLDLMMPNMSGDQAIPHLLEASPTSMVVVYSGASADDDTQHQLLNAGAFAYYPKTDADVLTKRLTADLQRFQRVLDGQETVPSWMTDGHGGH